MNIISFLLIFTSFFIAGCSSTQCGIEKSAFDKLSTSAKSNICISYNKTQSKLAILSAQKEVSRFNKNKEEIKYIYNHASATDIVLVSIINGTFKPYGFSEKIIPIEFQLARGEVKKICVNSNRNDSSCFWVTYQGSQIIWNLEPDFYKSKNNLSYIDNSFNNGFYVDKSMYVISSKNWFRGSYHSIRFRGDLRSVDMNFNVRIYYLNQKNHNYK
jgi:hypothetical protein